MDSKTPAALAFSPCAAKTTAFEVPLAVAKCCPHCGKHFADMPNSEAGLWMVGNK